MAQVPLSTRVKRKGGGSEFGNQVTTMALSLATDISDPGERMNASFRNSQGSKEMTKALSTHQIMELTETTPPGLMALGVRPYAASHLSNRIAPLNVVISNVPGPDHLYYLAGVPVERVIPVSMVLGSVGL